MKSGIVLGLILLASAPWGLRAQEPSPWEGTALRPKLLEKYILSEEVCLENEKFYVGCRLLKDTLTSNGELLSGDVLQLHNIAKADFKKENARSLLKWKSFWKVLYSDYSDSVKKSPGKLASQIYNIFLEHAFDPHTRIEAREKFQRSQVSAGPTAGIGVIITRNVDKVLVVRLYEGGPAQEAGLQLGDEIRTIDGKTVNAETFAQASRWLLGGGVGSKVQVEVNRGGKNLRFHMTRAHVEDLSFIGKKLESTNSPKTYAYLKVQDFSDTDSFLGPKKFFNQEEVENYRGYILDLRDNPGGNMDFAADLASAFLPDSIGKVRDGILQKEIYSTKTLRDELVFPAYSNVPQKTALPVIILTNIFTGSAAEMLTAKLQESGRALVVGERTVGKATKQGLGLVNSFTPGFSQLPDSTRGRLESELIFIQTAGHFQTPQGWTHQDEGVTPNILVESKVHLAQHIREGEAYPFRLKNNSQAPNPVEEGRSHSEYLKNHCLSQRPIAEESPDPSLETAKSILDCMT